MAEIEEIAGEAKLIHLERLDLDPHNPRFGGGNGSDVEQAEIINRIITSFGVNDVLSSLSVNGYFRAEPLVGRAGKDGRITIVEGNRRLAACLLLTGDERAKKHANLATRSQKVWDAHGRPSVDPVPVIVFSDTENWKELLSYLGVRHISASAPWDSYAKAAWVAAVVAENSLSVAEVAQMVGDNHSTVSRLLEGYYFVNQAINLGAFDPSNSQKSGRGSVTAYPFSWVYTVLGYVSARRFLGIDESDDPTEPIPEGRLDEASILLRAMFGDKSEGMSSAVSDSRELGDLAAVLGDSAKLALLESGNSIATINRQTRPLDERLRRNLAEIRSLQAEIINGLAEKDITEEEVHSHLSAATAARKQSAQIERQLLAVIAPPDDD